LVGRWWSRDHMVVGREVVELWWRGSWIYNSVLLTLCAFSSYSGFIHQLNWLLWYCKSIVESGVKHHKHNPWISKQQNIKSLHKLYPSRIPQQMSLIEQEVVNFFNTKSTPQNNKADKTYLTPKRFTNVSHIYCIYNVWCVLFYF
jgi:hypothetical protein